MGCGLRAPSSQSLRVSGRIWSTTFGLQCRWHRRPGWRFSLSGCWGSARDERVTWDANAHCADAPTSFPVFGTHASYEKARASPRRAQKIHIRDVAAGCFADRMRPSKSSSPLIKWEIGTSTQTLCCRPIPRRLRRQACRASARTSLNNGGSPPSADPQPMVGSSSNDSTILIFLADILPSTAPSPPHAGPTPQDTCKKK